MLFSESERRTLFPVTRDWAYFNHAAVGPLPAYVAEAAREYVENSSRMGEKHWEITFSRMESLRAELAAYLGAEPHEIAFTRNTSEGLSVLAAGLDWREGENVVVPAGEFPSNVYPWLALGRRGVQTRFVPLSEGGFSPEAVMACTDARTRVVALSSVQFHNGFAGDLARIGQACRSRGILCCVDAIQQLGVQSLDVRADAVDFLACGSHKWLLAGEGIGFLYCRATLAEQLAPVLVGWSGVKNWEDFQTHALDFREGALRFETGNLSAFGVWALHASLMRMKALGWGRISAQVGALARQVREAASARGWRLGGPPGRIQAGIVSFQVPETSPEALVEALMRKGVQASVRNGAIRVSPHFYNTSAEVGQLFTEIDGILNSPC